MNFSEVIASELNVRAGQVQAAIDLLDEGSTVPFIARYRKEMTQNLDDAQLRNLSDRLIYFRELVDRKKTVLDTIEKQKKLTPELEAQITACLSKSELEDIYLPYKPKRRTKAQIAIEAGLDELADAIISDPTVAPEQQAERFINAEKGVPDTDKALEGAQYILMERYAENAELVKRCRQVVWENGVLVSTLSDDSHAEKEKFRDYFSHEERLSKAPSHRVLALLRGRALSVLRVLIKLEDCHHQFCLTKIAEQAGIFDQGRPADAWLKRVVDWTWRVKLLSKLEVDCFIELRQIAEKTAIEVFAENLKNLLLASPAGPKVTIGLDPGFRTGVKLVVVDKTGKLLDHETIFPHAPQKRWSGALALLKHYVEKHQVELISIGNGTASRETDKLVADLQKLHPEFKLQRIVISEAGASVYSASELASKEFPSLDVSYRGAVSIARRLQDPLAELVKIEPKAIGVGQYQHDVNQVDLARKLDAVIEDCVNKVGVDVNMASSALLRRISGLNQTLADNIVSFRDQNGAFLNRKALNAVPRMGDKTFEQAAGFLRISFGDNLLDSSSVHPEAYPVVMSILEKNNCSLQEVIGNSQFLKQLKAKDYVTEQFGLPTVKDILAELDKPGRDPRPEFKMATLRDDVEKISDLSVGMVLEGTVTNVTPFGAFVDIGVHQDGLVHKSELAPHYVESPAEFVQVGQIVKVKVLQVEAERKRISLSMNLESKKDGGNNKAASPSRNIKKQEPVMLGGLGAALQAALTNKK